VFDAASDAFADKDDWLAALGEDAMRQDSASKLWDAFFKSLKIDDVRDGINEDEHRVIAALAIMPGMNRKKLGTFFRGVYTHARLREILSGLEDGLIVLRTKDKDGKPFYALNSALKETLKPFTSYDEILFPSIKLDKKTAKPVFRDERAGAAVLAFTFGEIDFFKADGEVKRKTEDEIEKIFGKD
jgi:hypothetical protein